MVGSMQKRQLHAQSVCPGWAFVWHIESWCWTCCRACSCRGNGRFHSTIGWTVRDNLPCRSPNAESQGIACREARFAKGWSFSSAAMSSWRVASSMSPSCWWFDVVGKRNISPRTFSISWLKVRAKLQNVCRRTAAFTEPLLLKKCGFPEAVKMPA